MEWKNVTESQYEALQAVGAPTRIVHQAKVPESWESQRKLSPPRRKELRARTDMFRLGVANGATPLREGSNIDRVYKAIARSVDKSLTVARSRGAFQNDAEKRTGLNSQQVSAMISTLESRGWLVYDKVATAAKAEERGHRRAG